MATAFFIYRIAELKKKKLKKNVRGKKGGREEEKGRRGEEEGKREEIEGTRERRRWDIKRTVKKKN